MEKPDFAVRPQSLTKTARFINFWLHRLVRLLLWIMRVDFKVTNKDIVPKKGPVVLVCGDHTSLADAIFMIASINRPYAGVGMAELLSDEWPWIIRKAFELLGHIPIVRGNSASGDFVFEHGKHALAYRQMLVLWAQGRQVRRGDQDAPWYPGFARFAKTMNAPIYIYKIVGPGEFWPTHPDDGGPQAKNWRAKVRATFSGPINPHDYASIDELIAATRTIYNGLELPD